MVFSHSLSQSIYRKSQKGSRKKIKEVIQFDIILRFQKTKSEFSKIEKT